MRFTRKKLAAVAAGALTLGLGVGAYAYWTTTGAGDGSATVASANGTVTLHASLGDGIYPGGSQSVTFTADNAGDTDLYVDTISLDSVDVDSGHATCDTTDFTMDDVTSDTVVTAGASGQAITGTGTLEYANDSTNSQDACKGATITLNVSSN
jgi:hypothetical protein